MTDTAQPIDGAPTGDEPGEQPTDWQKEAEKWQALARKHEKRATANAEKATAFDDFQESQKSEQQKLADQLARTQAELADTRTTALRHQIAAAKGVPAALLTGATEDELTASADALLAFRGEQPQPQPFLGQGQRSAPPPQDGNAWLRGLQPGTRATTRHR